MNVNSKIIAALLPQGLDASFNVYKGNKDKYFVFNYADERAEFYANDEAQIDVAYVQIHFFAPSSFNLMATKKTTISALVSAGFSYPTTQCLYEQDTDYNHLIFSTSIDGESERG